VGTVKSSANNHGFTLFELMIVLCIMGVLLSVATSSILKWLPEYRFTSFTRDLQSTVQNARLAAIKNNADVFLQFDKTNRDCKVFLDDGNPSYRGQLDVADTLIQTLNMPTGVDYTSLFGSATDTVANCTFNTRGFSSPSGTICMKNNKNKYKGISLTLTGNSKIMRSLDGGTTWQ
jgi:prepilin-type N-terminal cleavage/methylation domain-containing protein